MTIIEIKRIEKTPIHTIGVLSIDKEVVCFTMELPWRMNRKNISCIPEGQYPYHTYLSETYNRVCFAVSDVFGRTSVRLHQGNFLSDTRGCILPGLCVGVLNKQKAVLRSNDALDSILSSSYTSGIIDIN